MQRKNSTDTEKLILETAEKLFLEKGFAKTSTVEIAREAGCNQALVHYYFRTKENLFHTIFEDKIRLFAYSFLVDNKSLTFEEDLKQKIEAHFDILRANPKVPFLLFNEFLSNEKRLKEFGKTAIRFPQALLAKLAAGLKKEIDRGTIRPVEPLGLLITVISLNVTLFLAAPIFKEVVNMSDEELDAFYERRKKENVRIILGSLKP